MISGNIFDNAPRRAKGEIFTELLAAEDLRVERILSYGQASPPGLWCDQPFGEWVLLLQGSAGLRFEDEPAARRLQRGDYLHIAAHRRHRVEWTQAGSPTIWLAVHHGAGCRPGDASSAANPAPEATSRP